MGAHHADAVRVGLPQRQLRPRADIGSVPPPTILVHHRDGVEQALDPRAALEADAADRVGLVEMNMDVGKQRRHHSAVPRSRRCDLRDPAASDTDVVEAGPTDDGHTLQHHYSRRSSRPGLSRHARPFRHQAGSF